MATYTFQNEAGKYVQVMQHLQVFDIELLSSSLHAGEYTIVTNVPVPADQVEHLGMTEA